MNVRFPPMLRPRCMADPLSPDAEAEMHVLFDRHLARRFDGILVARGWARPDESPPPAVLGAMTFRNKLGDVVLRIDFDLAWYRLRDWLADRLDCGPAKRTRQHKPETQWRRGVVGHPTRLRALTEESA